MRIFKEEQRFTQPLITVTLTLSFLVVNGIVIREYLKDDSDLNLTELSIIIGLFIVFTLPIFLIKLITRIDDQGVHYCFFPFHRKHKTISWYEIKSASVRKYDPIGDYGGWGIKGGSLWNSSKGKAINVKGTIGIQLELNNSKKVLIGTQKEVEAIKVLEYYRDKLV